MEYCASAMSMLGEEIWQIAEGFVEVSANLYAQLNKCSKGLTMRISTMWKTESVLTKLPQLDC